MPLPGKPPSESIVQMTELVLPPDANALGTVFGGKVMQWIDIAGSIAAMRHCRRQVVTASMDELSFHAPIHVGQVAILDAQVLAAFRTSLECAVTVHSEDLLTGERRLCTSALLTFVALGPDGRAVEVCPVEPRTDSERQALLDAQARRAARLARRG